LDLAGECLRKAKDFEGLLLLYVASADVAGITELSQLTGGLHFHFFYFYSSLSSLLSPLSYQMCAVLIFLAAAGKNNVSFICNFLLGRVDECLELLSKSGRIAEAAFMARTFAPSKIPDVLHQWKKSLGQRHRKVADSLADPTQFPNLFPDFELVRTMPAFTDQRKETQFLGCFIVIVRE